MTISQYIQKTDREETEYFKEFFGKQWLGHNRVACPYCFIPVEFKGDCVDHTCEYCLENLKNLASQKIGWRDGR